MFCSLLHCTSHFMLSIAGDPSPQQRPKGSVGDGRENPLGEVSAGTKNVKRLSGAH